MRHALLGPRLIECTELVNRIEGRSIHQIFGSPYAVSWTEAMARLRYCLVITPHLR